MTNPYKANDIVLVRALVEHATLNTVRVSPLENFNIKDYSYTLLHEEVEGFAASTTLAENDIVIIRGDVILLGRRPCRYTVVALRDKQAWLKGIDLPATHINIVRDVADLILFERAAKG